MQYIIIILLLLVIIVGIIYYKVNRKKLEQQIKEDYLNKNRAEFNKQLNNEKQIVEDNLLLQIDKLVQQRDAMQREMKLEEESHATIILHCKQREQEYEQQRALLMEQEKQRLASVEALVEEKKQKVQTEVDAYKEVEMCKARIAIDDDTIAQQKWADDILAIHWDALATQTQEKEQELASIIAELADYKKKQQAINEAILRQRAIDEQQDFYRVCLSEFAIEDIKLLQEIRQKLHTSDNLNKLIYDVYVSKSVQEMVKRVLQGAAPSGIYKITRLKTGEIYIGKSTNVKDRWIQHCKTVYGAGTIAHSILHTTMAKDGLEQFTFELVEEVPKEKLTEREKYWIMFYGSKEYGLNERNG